MSAASQGRGVSSKESNLGKVQILNRKVDVSKVVSKCGSKDNIKHKPGGGDVKIESHRLNFKGKAQSKVGSKGSQPPGGGSIKAEGAQETSGGEGPTQGVQSGSATAQENGMKDGAPSDSGGLQEAPALDPHIPETN